MNCINFVVPMNPCPCGYFPDSNRCTCTQSQVRRYQGKVSGPILERFDLCVRLEQVTIPGLQTNETAESSTDICRRVEQARKKQEQRFADSDYRFNGDIKAADMEKYCALGMEERRLMEELYRSMQLSARSYHRILRVARTIADLEGTKEIGEAHLLEAAFYRPAYV